jgi:hypothetical protein
MEPRFQGSVIYKSACRWCAGLRIQQRSGKGREGAQLAGFANYSRNVTGLQAAGFANIASGTNTGLQVAGFLNYATEVRGLQLSLFNISDTVSAGVPVGLLSFVAKGYHTFEVTANELFPLNISLKTGIRHFYNILAAGIGKEWLSAGYGLGTQFRLTKKMTLSMDVTGNYVTDNKQFTNYKGALLRFSPTVGLELARHLKFVAGPTLNGFVGLDTMDPLTGAVPLLFSIPVKSQVVGGNPMAVWIGATAGFRF